MHDESQAQEQETPGASGQSAGSEASQSETPQSEAAQPSTDAEPTAADGSPAPEPQAGGDVSTTPATAPTPLPGVPAQPVNAVAEDGNIPGPRMEPERIGEAISPRQA